MQRQLQLRIEAQGKYLKKIIEEQQKLSGVLSEAPAGDDNRPESKNNADPITPAALAFEPPLMEKSTKGCAGPVDERCEPLTPDSGCHVGSPLGERSMKKQRVSMGLTHQILESSIRPPFHHLTTEQFGHSSGMPHDNED